MFGWRRISNHKAGLIFIGLTLLFCIQPAWGQQGQGVTTVHVVGSSPIRDDMSSSRQKAIDLCLETAVSQALLNTISQERLADNFQLVGDTVYNRTDRFVRDYKVVAESTHGNIYRVLVKATISMDLLTAALSRAGVSSGGRDEMRVLICVAEKQVSDLNYQYWWGDQAQAEVTVAPMTIAQKLQEAGISVVTINPQISGTLGYPAELNAKQAAALAREMKANVVVIGRVRAEQAPNTMGNALKSFRGAIEMDAYFAQNQEPMAHIAQDKLVASDDLYQGSQEALQTIALQAGDTLARELKDAWLGRGAGTAPLEMVIEGTGGHIANFVQFRGALGNTSGVDNLQLKEMKPDSAVLLVDYQGNARSLAGALLLKSFDTFGINIVETGHRYIRLRLIPH